MLNTLLSQKSSLIYDMFVMVVMGQNIDTAIYRLYSVISYKNRYTAAKYPYTQFYLEILFCISMLYS